MADRRERVIFDATDNLSPAMMRMAAASKVLDKSLDGTGRSAKSMGRNVDTSSRDVDRATNSIDRYSGRLGMLLAGLTAVGPALIPLGGAGLQAITGLANQFGFAATGAATALVAFQGVGDALKALNTARLEPTTANLTKAQIAMEQISPAAQDLAKQLHNMTPMFKELRDHAATSFFPGLTEGLTELSAAAPRAASLLDTIGSTLGEIAAEGGASMASDRWGGFLDFIEAEAPDALHDLATATGNTTHALAGMWMAFSPVNNQFSDGLVAATERLDTWAAGLSSNKSFQGFLDYLEENGPAAASAIGSINDMLVSLTAATAPLGGPTLRIIAAFADAIAAIADSPLGTPLIALAQLASVAKLTSAAYTKAAASVARFNATAMGSRSALPAMNAGLKSAQRNVGILATGFATAGARTERETARMARASQSLKSTMGKAGVAAGGMAVAMSPLPEKLGLSNTALMTMMGSLGGPWGYAIGASIGLLSDFAAANDDLAAAAKRARKAVDGTEAEQADALKASAEQFEEANNPSSLMGKFAKLQRDLPGPLGYTLGIIPKVMNDNAYDGALKDQKALIDAMKKSRAELDALKPGLATAFGSDVAGAATRSVLEFNQAVTRANEILAQRGGMRAFEASLDAAADAIKRNGQNLDINTKKGRENEAALDQIAASALKVTENMEAADRAPVLARARNQIIKTATAMGMGKQAAAELAAKLLQLDRQKVQPKIDVNANPAIAGVAILQGKLSQLRDKTITIYTRSVTTSQKQKNPASGLDGMLNPQRRAYGGAINGPGGPRDDLIPLMASNGEHIIPADEVQAAGGQSAIYRLRAAIRSGSAPRFADGGAVGDWIEDGLEDLEYFANGGAVKRRGKKGNKRGGKGPAAALRRLEAAADRAHDALDAETKKRDEATSSWQNLGDSIKGTLTSDLFGDKSAGWAWMSAADRNAKMTGDVFSKLQFDIGQSSLWSSLSANLGSRGVSGQALQALFEQGGVEGLQAMAGLDNASLARYQALFDQRAASIAATATASSDRIWSAEINRLNAQVATLTKTANQADKKVAAAKKAGKKKNASVAGQLAGGAKAAKARAKHKRK